MKIRRDFVTNSSSSSYVCEICGRSESGWDICLSDAEMVHCVNGHTYCEHEMLPIPRKDFIKTILEQAASKYIPDELARMSDEVIASEYLRIDDSRWELPEECCPICQFIEYFEDDLCQYLLKKYHVPHAEVFEKVKAVNKRRKKLYDSEYITEVCQRFNLNPIDIVAGWKTEFGTYKKFKQYISKDN